MKVRLSQLHPNPFRDLVHYPVEQEKMELLKSSIKTTSMWPNLMNRPHPSLADAFEIVYGHARLFAAIEELGPDAEVEVPEPRALSDADMLRIMARENDAGWRVYTHHDREVIRAARNYLLAHPERWTKKATTNTGSGPGAKAIADFLKWPVKKIANHLEVIVPVDNEEVKATLVEHMPLDRARKLVPLARRRPSNEQEAIARRFNEEDLPESTIPIGWHQAPVKTLDIVYTAERQVTDATRKLAVALDTILTVPEILQAVLDAATDIDATEDGGPFSVDKLFLALERLRQIVDEVLQWCAPRVPRPPRLVKDAEPDPDNPDPFAEGSEPGPWIGRPAQPDEEEPRQAWGRPPPPSDNAPKKRTRQRQQRKRKGA
jgi:hypothetical protein